MYTKTSATVSLTIAERDAIKAAGEIERRTISNFMLLASLERAKAMHDIEPVYGNEEKSAKEE